MFVIGARALPKSLKGWVVYRDWETCVADGKQVNIPVPIYSAMWGRRRLAQPTVGIVGSSL